MTETADLILFDDLAADTGREDVAAPERWDEHEPGESGRAPPAGWIGRLWAAPTDVVPDDVDDEPDPAVAPELSAAARLHDARYEPRPPGRRTALLALVASVVIHGTVAVGA